MARTQRDRTSVRKLNQYAKVQRCLEMRKRGLTWSEIAEREGYPHRQGPHNLVMGYLNEVKSETAEELRALENERLDELLSAHYPQAVNAAHEDRFRATDRVLAISERRAKMNGLDQQRLSVDTGPLGLNIIVQRGLEILKEHPELEHGSK